mgnify:CR=1 FL=1
MIVSGTKDSMKEKLLVLGLASFLLNGCSEFYGYQPPAPVYGRSQGSNPYEKQSNPLIRQPVGNENQTYNKQLPESKELSAKIDGSSVYKEPLVARKTSSPAVLALVSEADRSSRAGDLESAVVTIERALRIDSRNPELTYKLAMLRLKQSKPRLAEDLAKKAAMLAANDNALKKRSWLLISEARRQQKNYYGAKEAKIKANKF